MNSAHNDFRSSFHESFCELVSSWRLISHGRYANQIIFYIKINLFNFIIYYFNLMFRRRMRS